MSDSQEIEEDIFDDRIDLTPLIDTVFLLLIFFIMATSFSRPVMELMLPHSESASLPERQRRIALEIDQAGQVSHQGQALDRDGIDRLLDDNPDIPLSVYVDSRSPFESFSMVLDQARLNNRHDLAIISAGKPDDEP